MAKLPVGRKKKKSEKDKIREAYVKHHHERNEFRPRADYRPPENCTWCKHRRRDRSEKYEVETCAIHKHPLPPPLGEAGEVVGCETCEARWCPQFEAVPMKSQPAKDWFKEKFGSD